MTIPPPASAHRGVSAEGERPVMVIVYSNDLLGCGIARWIEVRTGTRPVLVPAGDSVRVHEVLASAPLIVVFECGDIVNPDLLRQLSPTSRLVDVSHAVAGDPRGVRPVEQCETGLQMLADMVEAVSTADADVVSLGSAQVHPTCT